MAPYLHREGHAGSPVSPQRQSHTSPVHLTAQSIPSPLSCPPTHPFPPPGKALMAPYLLREGQLSPALLTAHSNPLPLHPPPHTHNTQARR
jgi:hypothetical protein